MSARTTTPSSTPSARARPWLALALLTLAACGGDWCPDPWQARDPSVDLIGEQGNCEPPAFVTERADVEMRTGIYGYVLACEERDDDGDCGCEVIGPYTEGGDVWIGVDKPYPEQDWIYFTVRPDSTYQVELLPGVRYSLNDSIVGSTAGVTWDEVPITDFVLEEGEILFIRLTAAISC